MSTSTTSRPMSRLSTRRGVTARRKRRAVLALLALLLAVGGSLTFAGLASAAPQTVIDQGGEDDLTGQKDLNSLTVDYGLPGATSVGLSWNWDDTATSGANTRDACSLFDTDNDGFANYAFCLTVNDDTTVSTARLYSCDADSRADRCGGPTGDTSFTSTGTASVVAGSDPFKGSPTHQDGNDCDANPACNSDDAVAVTSVQLADFGGATATLLNVCSYPSQEPNSDPSDCVFVPDAGFIRIVKDATPNTTATFSFTLDGVSAFSTNGDGTSALLPVSSSTNHAVAETAATGWELSTASCLKADGTTTTGTLSGTTISGIDPNPGEVVTCTFNNIQSTGTLTLVKTVDNLGETGAGYKGVSDFPLTIDGNSTTSGTAVTVTAGNHTIAETAQAGYTVGTWSCTDGTTGTAGSVSATVSISGGENVTCTITNTLIAAPALSLVKTASPTSYDSVGDVISYSYLVTNTGNVTLAGPVTVADDKATVTCPAGGLAPGGSMTCTASYTITQADLDSGSVKNTAKASANGTNSNEDDETVTAVQSRALSLVKTASPTTYDSVGDLISYSYLVTNTGNVSLAGPVTVADDKATVTCPAGGLAPQASMTCTASYTITQADLDSGSVTNTARASANGINSNEDSETVTAVQNPALSLTKVATEQSFDSVGDVINYTIVARNTGNVTLASVTVTDPKVSGLVCTPANGSSLAPGASMTCSASHTVTQADLDAGSYANTACVNDGAGGAAEACASEDVPAVQSRALSLVKTASPTSYDSVGDLISYSYLVTNTGNVSLAGPVTVADDKATVTCPAGGLAPQASMTCTASYTITQADLDSGSVTNTARASANGINSNEDSETVTAVQNPALSLTKVATEQSFDSVGDVINYTIVARNTGNVTLASVTVTDPKVSGLVCTPANGSSLAPGASMTCSASHTVTQADLDAGSYANTACVNDGAGGAAEACASEDVPADQNPALSLTKVATEQSFDSVGDVINYTIVARNTGNVTLASVTVTDPKVSGLVCTPANGSSLAPGASMTCSASHTVTQADLDAGSYANTACVNDGAGGAAEACASEDVPAVQSRALSLVKTASPTTYDSVGDLISYSYLVTNTGNVSLAGPVTVADDKATVTCPAGGLAPQASMTCTASYTITQADLDSGSVTNTARASANGINSNEDSETVTAVQNPALSLTKVATEQSFDSVGDVINYTIVARNTGNVTLASVTVTDPKVSGLVCTPANGSSLAPGASMTCSASHTVTQADLDAGSYANTACVNDGAGGAAEACASEDVPADQNPALSLTKVATEQSFDSVGDVINYTIVARNTGNVTLASVTVTDPKVSGLVCTPANGSSLAPGASMTCSASHTVTQADLDAGSYANTACVNDGAGGAAEACASEDVPADQNPALSLAKSANPTVYSAVGQVITYTYVITNTGNVTLLGPFTITDNKIATVTCPTGSLAPSATRTCTGTYTIQAGDMSVSSITNTATASTTYNGNTVTSNQAQATIYRQTAQILPTQTTCADYKAGATSYQFLDYNINKGTISSVAPGVFFYYNEITVTAAQVPYTVTVSQTHTSVSPNWPPIPIQDLGQVILWDYATCTKSSAQGPVSYNPSTGQVQFTVTQPGTYVISIKYNPSALQGTPVNRVQGVYPSVTYTFGDGTPQGSAGITVRPKK